MNTVPDKQLHEATSKWLATLDALRIGMPERESESFIREVFAVFLLLRWIELQDAEQSAMATFEGRTYEPLLPATLSWLLLMDSDQTDFLTEQELAKRITGHLKELADVIDDQLRLQIYAGDYALTDDAAHPAAAYLHALAGPLRRVLKVMNVHFVYLLGFVRWVANLPFGTPRERRALMEVFDQVIAETDGSYDGLHSTPTNVARLVAALANPQPGERVYDPCSGSGNLLAAAWQQAERSRNELRRPGALLEVAGIEINDSAFLVGLTRMLLAGIEQPRLVLGNSLLRESLNSPVQQGYDLVLANPPIGAKLNRELYRHFAIPSSDSTSLFIQHALSQLKPHGRAVIVVSDGFLFKGGAERELRRYLLEKGHVEAVVGLPAGAFAPHSKVKCSLLVLSKQGGFNRIRMADASSLFEQRTSQMDRFIPNDIAEQLAVELRRPELLMPVKEQENNILDQGFFLRKCWETSVSDLEATDWDLTPHLRITGGLNALLSSFKEKINKESSISSLALVAEVFGGRSVKSIDLMTEPPPHSAVGYVRIKDLIGGKVGRLSSWLQPDLADKEKRWTLRSGDVLVSKSGTIGKTAVVRNDAVGAIASQGLYVLRPQPDTLDPDFLLAYLSSPACLNWLAAQSRGTGIQHLNRSALELLLVPLPPMHIQKQASDSFRKFGTDALTFLSQVWGSDDSNRLTIWLAELESKVPKFSIGFDETPPLSRLEPILLLVDQVRNWMSHGEAVNHDPRWVIPLHRALRPLKGVSQIPLGPGLLSVLQEAERGTQAVLENATGQLPTELQARAISERLRDWLRAAISDLVDTFSLKVLKSPSSLSAGSFAEFSVELLNDGALPLRNVRVESQPDWGNAAIPYFAEQSTALINLRGDTPKQGSNLTLRLLWRANDLSGKVVEGAIEIGIRLDETESIAVLANDDLGGSPYVTGSPLDPDEGNEVFFGREDLLEKVSRQVVLQGNVVLLEGNRRAGKTSILRHLEGAEAVPNWLAVYSSLQGAEGAKRAVGVPTEAVFREIAGSIATAVIKTGVETPLPDGSVVPAGGKALGIGKACRSGISVEAPFADFREYLEVILAVLGERNIGLLLMLDEFDKLQEGIDHGVTSPQVPENIRYLIQTYPRFSAILTGSRRLKRLREEYWSALYGLGTSIQVTALDTESAKRVVTEPVIGKLIYSPEAVDRALTLTARQPYLLQCLCNRIFDFAVATKSRAITLSSVDNAAIALVKDNEHFASLWDYAAQGLSQGRCRRQYVLALLAGVFHRNFDIDFGGLLEMLVQQGVEVGEEALAADLEYLRELDLVTLSTNGGTGRYRLAIPLMSEWINQQQDEVVVRRRAMAEAEEEND